MKHIENRIQFEGGSVRVKSKKHADTIKLPKYIVNKMCLKSAQTVFEF